MMTARRKAEPKPAVAKSTEHGEPITVAQATDPGVDNQGELSQADLDNGNWVDGQGSLHKVSFPDGKFEMTLTDEHRVSLRTRGWIGDDTLTFHVDDAEELIALLKRA